MQLTHNMSADFGYTHVFIENGAFERVGPASADVYAGYVESQVDIFSVSLKARLGGERPLEHMKWALCDLIGCECRSCGIGLFGFGGRRA